MEEQIQEQEQQVRSFQLKQEHLIYGLAAALVLIVILVGSVLYLVSSGGGPGQGPESATPQLPAGHPPIRPGAVPGPLDPSQLPGAQQDASGQSNQQPSGQTQTPQGGGTQQGQSGQNATP